MIPAKLLIPTQLLAALTLTAAVALSVAPVSATPAAESSEEEAQVQVLYLEIVTPDMDATCALLEELQGVKFGEPEAAKGNARTAALAGGGRIGVRKPLSDTETPVVRPYLRVEDIEAAFGRVEAAEGTVMMAPTPDQQGGRFAIYLLGGIEHAIWQP